MTEAANLRNYSPLDYAADLLAQLNGFLSETPVVSSEDEYREGAKLSKLAGNALKDIDDERKRELAPLALETGKINHRYKERTLPLNELVGALTKRLTDFAKAEEGRRAAEAAEKRRLADEAAEKAAAAVRANHEAADDASQGAEVDILATFSAGAAALREAEKAERIARRAERDVTLRVRTGYGSATSMRNREELTVEDAVAALTELGSSPDIDAEIVKAAKAWRKLHGRLPAGVTSTINRSL